jgi:hypothetical protein
MDKENVVHVHKGILLAINNVEIMLFARKWIELLSKLSQIQKDR